MIAAKNRLAQKTSPLVAAAEESAKSRYLALIVILGIITVSAATMAVYVRKAKA